MGPIFVCALPLISKLFLLFLFIFYYFEKHSKILLIAELHRNVVSLLLGYLNYLEMFFKIVKKMAKGFRDKG